MFITPACLWQKEQVVLSFEHCTSSHTSQKPSLTDTSSFPQSHAHTLVQRTNSPYVQLTRSVLRKSAESLVGIVKPQKTSRHGSGSIAPTLSPAQFGLLLLIDSPSCSSLFSPVQGLLRTSIPVPFSQALLSLYPVFKPVYSINQPSTVHSIKIFHLSNWSASQNSCLWEP